MYNWFSDLLEYKAGLFGLLLPELIYYLIILLLLISILKSIFKAVLVGRPPTPISEPGTVDTVFVVCVTCQWKGKVPRFKKKCPRCGGTNFLD